MKTQIALILMDHIIALAITVMKAMGSIAQVKFPVLTMNIFRLYFLNEFSLRNSPEKIKTFRNIKMVDKI